MGERITRRTFIKRSVGALGAAGMSGVALPETVKGASADELAFDRYSKMHWL